MTIPSISVVVPTYNSGRTLSECLASIQGQDYPKDKIEVILVDGGSTDLTLDIASHFNVKVLSNPLRSGEAGKAVGVTAASHDIIALIDSDNILPTLDWLQTMVEPFNEDGVVASEPLYYSYRRGDPLITRYCALLGMNDVLCLYFGNYDRYCLLTGKWTSVRTESVTDKGSYLLVEFSERRIPTVGANGFLVRRSVLKSVDFRRYLFDIDMVFEIVRGGHNRFAKVKTGIIHLYANNTRSYVRKTWRRISDYLYYLGLGRRSYPWSASRNGLQKFVIAALLPPFLAQDIVKGYRRKPDIAWLFHFAATWITFITYSSVYMISLLRSAGSSHSRGIETQSHVHAT